MEVPGIEPGSKSIFHSAFYVCSSLSPSKVSPFSPETGITDSPVQLRLSFGVT